MERFSVPPGGTVPTGVGDAPAMRAPPTKTATVELSHAQVPLFCNSHVFANVPPGAMMVLSGMVTSAKKRALKTQVTAVGGGVGVRVGAGMGVAALLAMLSVMAAVPI